MSEGDEEMRDDFNPSQGGGRGGPSGYRGGRGGGGRGRGGGRPYGGDRDGDKNSRNNNRQTGSMGDSQDQQVIGGQRLFYSQINSPVSLSIKDIHLRIVMISSNIFCNYFGPMVFAIFFP